MAAAEPSPAAVMTWARGFTAFPAAQTPGTLVRPVASVTIQPLSWLAQPRRGEQAVVGYEAGPNEHCGPRHRLAGVELDAGQVVVLDDQAGRPGSSTTPMARAASCSRWSAVSSGAVGEEHDVVGPLPDEVRVGDGLGSAAEHAEGLIADLVPVAVRAVQEVATPALTDAGDVGELVAQAGGDQDAPGSQGPAVVEDDVEVPAARDRSARGGSDARRRCRRSGGRRTA